jgi:hypothetical protein
METSDVEDAARLLDPVRDEDTPGDSRDVPVAADQAMEGTSEEYSSVQKTPND